MLTTISVSLAYNMNSKRLIHPISIVNYISKTRRIVKGISNANVPCPIDFHDDSIIRGTAIYHRATCAKIFCTGYTVGLSRISQITGPTIAYKSFPNCWQSGFAKRAQESTLARFRHVHVHYGYCSLTLDRSYLIQYLVLFGKWGI